MGNTLVQTQIIEVKNFLTHVVVKFENFLNEMTLSKLVEEKAGDPDYYRMLISNLRKLLVYCEEGSEACQVIVKNEPFAKATAEKTLYRIYHQCIEEFFAPKSDYSLRIVVLPIRGKIQLNSAKRLLIVLKVYLEI